MVSKKEQERREAQQRAQDQYGQDRTAEQRTPDMTQQQFDALMDGSGVAPSVQPPTPNANDLSIRVSRQAKFFDDGLVQSPPTNTGVGGEAQNVMTKDQLDAVEKHPELARNYVQRKTGGPPPKTT